VSWPLPEDPDDRRLEELLFPNGVGRPSATARSLPDFAAIRRQLQAHKHLIHLPAIKPAATPAFRCFPPGGQPAN
jgi:hypothetical protein